MLTFEPIFGLLGKDERAGRCIARHVAGLSVDPRTHIAAVAA